MPIHHWNNLVNLVEGNKTLSSQVDLKLIAKLSFVCARYYDSARTTSSIFGVGWHFSWNMTLQEAQQKLYFIPESGQPITLNLPDIGEEYYCRHAQIWIQKLSETLYLVYGLDEKYMLFEQLDPNVAIFYLKRIEDQRTESIELIYHQTQDIFLIDTITDSSTNQLKLHYIVCENTGDNNIRLSQIEQIYADSSREISVSYEYDQYGQLIWVRDQQGIVQYLFEYENNFLLIKQANVLGLTAHYQWDYFDDHCWRMIAYEDNSGQYFSFQYDLIRHITKIQNALGHKAQAHYNKERRITVYLDFDHLLYRYRYDELGHIAEIKLPTFICQQYQYDEFSRIIEYTEYDTQTKLKKVERYQYDQLSLRRSLVEDAHQQSWRQEFNDYGLLIKEISPAGHTTTYLYDDHHQLKEIIDAQDYHSYYEWNQRGQLTKKTNDLGHSILYEYNQQGHLVTLTDPLDRITRYERNQLGQFTTVYYPDQTKEQYYYNVAGLLVAHENAQGKRNKFIRDVCGRITEYQNYANQVTYYEYNALNQMVKLINPNGIVYEFEYDPSGKILSEHYPEQSAYQYRYDARGLLEKCQHLSAPKSSHYATDKTENTPQIIAEEIYKIDNWGRIIERANTTTKYSYRYNLLDQLLYAQTQPNRFGRKLGLLENELFFTYDLEGNLLSEQSTNGKLLYHYDELNSLIQIDMPDGQSIRYVRDQSGYVKNITFNEQIITVFERNQVHLETMRRMGKRFLRTEYDSSDRISKQYFAFFQPYYQSEPTLDFSRQTPFSVNNAFERSYRYDQLGRIMRVHDSMRGMQHFDYDIAGHLSQFSETDKVMHYNHLEKFHYDPAGNLFDPKGGFVRKQPHISMLLDNRVKHYRSYHYHYDDAGNVIRKVHENGDQLFAYDGAHHLVKASGVHQKRHETLYQYDALGRRISKQTQYFSPRGKLQDSSEKTDFIWAGTQMIQEIQYVDKEIMRITYVYASDHTLEPVAQIMQSGNIEDNLQQVLYYQNHLQHLPYELYDAQGQLKWAMHFNAFGKALDATAAALDICGLQSRMFHQRLRAFGQYFDQETGLHYQLGGYYCPDMGRFTSAYHPQMLKGENPYYYPISLKKITFFPSNKARNNNDVSDNAYPTLNGSG